MWFGDRLKSVQKRERRPLQRLRDIVHILSCVSADVKYEENSSSKLQLQGC